MTAGIPGSGLGGLFYFLLAVLMPLRELRLTLLGRSGVKRWANIIGIGFLCAGMMAALWGEGWLFKKAILASHGAGGAHMVALMTPAMAVTPFVALAVVIGGVHVARLCLELKRLSVRAVHARA